MNELFTADGNENESTAQTTQKPKRDLLKKIQGRISNAVDQNDDGKLDINDVSIIAEKVKNRTKDAISFAKETVANKSRENERRTLNPFFPSDLEAENFSVPKMLRITEIDKKRAESDVCKGSIGFRSVFKDLTVLNIFPDKVDYFGLSFYPDMDSEVYYVDPSNRNHYIALNDYFNYLKVQRVNELQRIAQDLGAKHFRVTYKEAKTDISTGKKEVKIKAQVQNEISVSSSSKEMSTVEIAAEMDCLGHEPVEPQLKYLQNESSIQTLIALRMSDNSVLHHKYTLNLSNSSGIKVNDAIKIDAALSAMNYTANTTITSEAQHEARRFFEYEIDF